MKAAKTPGATYRLQLNADFSFADARALIPYLRSLGITHVYSSPCLKTRTGSTHGYDIIDHNVFNPELGGDAGFQALVEQLREHGMGLIMDIVPNHMGVGSDNVWWMDVLEHGQASLHATHFDIDWEPNQRHLRHKLLLPFLGDYYGDLLERGELQLCFRAEEGDFQIAYFDHRFPIDPRTYSHILAYRLGDFRARKGSASEAELRELIGHFRAIPRRSAQARALKQKRRDMGQEGKRRLARLARAGAVRDWIRETLAQINGVPGQRSSFDRLHRLLESQAYRLANWRVAADEINYRRFFDINDLAGLRMEDKAVFETTHRLVAKLAREGSIHGVRIDHVDGLSDPSAYCVQLRHLLDDDQGEPGQRNSVIYLEKILAHGESLSPTWPVEGTTGYEFSVLLNGLFIHPAAEERLSRLYAVFALPESGGSGDVGRAARGGRVDFGELLYLSKRHIMLTALSGELSVLTNLLSRIAQSDRRTRDFTYNSLRNALIDIVAYFPVYRSYITAYRISEEDRRYIQQAIDDSLRRNPSYAPQYEFIHRVLVTARQALQTISHNPATRRRITAFCLRFQQYTSMVTAKGLEDTAGYRYQRLVALNEVGAHPDRFCANLEEFHADNLGRLHDWPHTMLSSSTHDSKRSEDLRARIGVISERAEDWERHVLRWQEWNLRHKRELNGRLAPSGNDEYLLYQTLVGFWPSRGSQGREREALLTRLQDYLRKAVREAKLESSWANPDEAYEEALAAFTEALLAPGDNPFLDDFLPFAAELSRAGDYAALSQTLLKFTVPGVPDIYQGNELLEFNLVDPDNRRPVDYARRDELLQNIRQAFQSEADKPALLQRWLADPEGSAKLFLTWLTLRLRQDDPALFSCGEYLPLEVQGPRAEHVVAFARRHEDRLLLVLACRWFSRLPDPAEAEAWRKSWQRHWLLLPPGGERGFRHLLTDAVLQPQRQAGALRLPLGDLLPAFPVGLLLSA